MLIPLLLLTHLGGGAGAILALTIATEVDSSNTGNWIDSPLGVFPGVHGGLFVSSWLTDCVFFLNQTTRAVTVAAGACSGPGIVTSHTMHPRFAETPGPVGLVQNAAGDL